MAEFESLPDAVPTYAANGSPHPLARWALLRDGIVVALTRTKDHLMHPFGRLEQGAIRPQHGFVALEGEDAINVTGTDCEIGYLADSKGNVTPDEGRTVSLRPGEPAYHGGPGVDLSKRSADEVGDGTGVHKREMDEVGDGTGVHDQDVRPVVEAAHDDAVEHNDEKPAPDRGN